MDVSIDKQYFKQLVNLFRPNEIVLNILLRDEPGNYGLIIKKYLII